MAIINLPVNVQIDTDLVTEAQLARCHRIVNETTGEVFYQVESASEPDVTYEVRVKRFNGRSFLTCDEKCKAAQKGIMCWHRRAAVAHALEYKAMVNRDTVETRAVKAPEVTNRQTVKGVQAVFFTVGTATVVMYERNKTFTCDCNEYNGTCAHTSAAQAFEAQWQQEYADWQVL